MIPLRKSKHYSEQELCDGYFDDPPLFYYSDDDDEEGLPEFECDEEYYPYDTAGVFDLKNAPDAVENLLERFGKWNVIEIRVYREAIVAAVKAVSQVLMAKKLPSKTYHVYQILKLLSPDGQDVQFVRIDKNEDVEVKYLDSWLNTGKREFKQVNGVAQRELTLEEYLAGGEDWLQQEKLRNPKIKNATFWKYNAAGSNCQYFAYWCLQGAGLMTPALESFFLQKDIKVPALSEKVFKGITSAAAIGSRVIGKLKSFFGGKKLPPKKVAKKAIPKRRSGKLSNKPAKQKLSAARTRHKTRPSAPRRKPQKKRR